MIAFDSLIVADWPKGLYLAQKLAAKNQKVAYVEVLPLLKNPFPVLVDEFSQTEKVFLEQLGFLYLQEGGLCFLSPKGVWPLQHKKEEALIKSVTELKAFKEDFMPYLSHNICGRCFEANDIILSEQKLNLFSDCFLFEASFKKQEIFKRNQPNIHFFKATVQEISLKQDQISFRDLSTQAFFCLTDRIQKNNSLKAYWHWQAFLFEIDLGSYNSILPSHLFAIKNLFLPWCYDNFMSLFKRAGFFEAWMRVKPNQNQNEVIKKAEQNLKEFFPGISLSFTNTASSKSFSIYGEDHIKANKTFNSSGYIQNPNDFFQADIVSEIKNEIQFYENIKDH